MHLLLLVCVFGFYGHKFAFADGQCCDDGWVAFRGHCYLFMDEAVSNWSDAMHHCKDNYNAYLATIETPAEDLFLTDHAKRLFKHIPTRRLPVWFWVGGTDEEVEGIWRWYNDHSTFNYTHWYPGEPSAVNTEDCLVLWGPFDFTGWGDYYCDQKSHYICEKSMVQTAQVEIVG